MFMLRLMRFAAAFSITAAAVGASGAPAGAEEQTLRFRLVTQRVGEPAELPDPLQPDPAPAPAGVR